MNAEFWNERWRSNQIAFHEGEANSLLREHFRELALFPGERVLVPLCGKTRDIHWLLSVGQKVVGIELVESAVEQLFAELSLEPSISQAGPLKLYQAENLHVFAGDVFELSSASVGPVDAIYDRAALVALPDDVRPKYAGHLVEISGGAPQLLITFEYDQSRMQGPPFSVDREMLEDYYSEAYEIREVASVDLAGGLRDLAEVKESLWLLR